MPRKDPAAQAKAMRDYRARQKAALVPITPLRDALVAPPAGGVVHAYPALETRLVRQRATGRIDPTGEAIQRMTQRQRDAILARLIR